ncbi:unnamed protein product, partial [Onchocerca ochengi]
CSGRNATINCNQTEEERASTNERTRQRMAQMQAKRCAITLEDARLRAHRSYSAASNLLHSQQNQRRRLNSIVEHGLFNRNLQ